MRYCPSCHRCFNDGVEFCLYDHSATFRVETLPPVIDGKYRLERLIAHGGMGSVYRAMHLQLERAVAIKILRAEFLADATVRERFHREARAAARLKHPNIVAIYDFGVLPGGGAYLVMELVEGRSLREELRLQTARDGQMREERAVQLLSQVCAGIEAAHRQGIVHRDLKPDNVMIEVGAEPPYGSERVLILDFGIAKLKEREQPLVGITDENTVIGTPNYISPEQCGGQAVDARADIYSLGVILYEMLTGRTPFAGQGTSAVLLKQIQEPPAPPRRLRPDLRPALEEVVLRALMKNPERRYASAAHFAQAMQAALARPAEEPAADEQTLRRRRPSEVFADVRPEEAPEGKPDALPVREPSLLIEHRPRIRFYALFLVLLLALGGFFGRLLLREWQGWQVRAGNVTPTPFASPPGAGVQPREASPEAPARQEPERAVRVSETPAVSPLDPLDRARQDVKAVYDGWAAAAVRGDWRGHMRYYDDRVEYFRDGAVSRARVEARKRRIFDPPTRYTLRFSEAPRIQFRTEGRVPEADVAFERQWRLCRGRKCRKGRARGAITLRRLPAGWRIVSEKQIGKMS